MLNWSVDALESVLATISRFVSGKQPVDYCELTTNLGVSQQELDVDPDAVSTTLVCKDCSLMTVFDLQGAYQIMGKDQFLSLCQEIRTKAVGYFGTGHQFSVVFEHDPEGAEQQLMELAEPSINTAKRIGLQSVDMLIDRVKRNTPYVAHEPAYLVVYTSPATLSKDQLKDDINELQKKRSQSKLPAIMYGQSPVNVLESLKISHDTFCQTVLSDFAQAGLNENGILMRPLPANRLVKELKTMIQRKSTHSDWRPTLFGDRFVPTGRESSDDYSNLTAPMIGYQLFSQDIYNPKGMGEIVESDGIYHGTLSVTQFPRDPQIFESLYNSMDHSIPWRVRYDLTPHGLDAKKMQRMMASFTAMTDHNRAVRDSFDYMEKLEKEGDDIACGLAVTFSTWADSYPEVKRNLSRLEKAVQGWGGCSVTGTHGDPFAAWAATMPGMTRANPAATAVPPMQDALSMMPLRRPASVWEHGQMTLRTPEGKAYPVELCSPMQDLWIELMVAPPGSGKSVLLNTLNSALIHSPGAVRLPLITWIDKGRSAQGQVAFLRDSLPDHQKHEVVEITLRNSREYGVNQFDLHLGCRYPTTHDKDYLRSFLTMLCYDASSSSAPSGVSDLMAELIDTVYDKCARTTPHTYEIGVEPRVDKVLHELDIYEEHDEDWWSETPWYEVMDILFNQGHTYEATLAQRQAVPVLTDFNAALNTPSIKQLYGEAKTTTGESLISYVERSLSAAAHKYACFAGRTVFDISSESRIVVIEMGQVLMGKTKEGRVQNALFYMFARNLGAKNYFINAESLLPVVPEIYQEYHKQRLRDVAEEMKTLCWDEFHNTGGIDVVVDMIITDAREGRKSGVRIPIATQYLVDVPTPLIDAATSIYVMRGKSESDAQILKERLRVSEDAQKRLDRECNGPGPHGGNMLAIFKTKIGQITQILTNTLGPIELWCYNTNQWDMALRAELYQRVDQSMARKILAKAFPKGTATQRIRAMKRRMGDESEGELNNSVTQKLASELLAEHADFMEEDQAA